MSAPSRATPVILLVRHGKAEDSHPLGDAGRALTAEGREEFREHARKVAGLVTLKGILTSPLVRAVQTAEILAEACDVGQVLVDGQLEAEHASARTIEALCRAAGPGWALVGHNPSMAEAVAHLTDQTQGAPRFRKGAVVALAAAAGALPWQIAWVAAPGRKVKQTLDD